MPDLMPDSPLQAKGGAGTTGGGGGGGGGAKPAGDGASAGVGGRQRDLSQGRAQTVEGRTTSPRHGPSISDLGGHAGSAEVADFLTHFSAFEVDDKRRCGRMALMYHALNRCS